MPQRSGLPVRVSTEPASTIDPAIQSLLAERRRRLEGDKRQKDAAEKAERVAKAHARHEAMLAAPESAQAKQAKYARETKEKLRQAKLEKERILKKIAADRTARKEHEDQRKTVAAHENRRIAGSVLASGHVTRSDRRNPTDTSLRSRATDRSEYVFR